MESNIADLQDEKEQMKKEFTEISKDLKVAQQKYSQAKIEA